MQEIWETYMKPLDGHPALVAFNAQAAESTPDEQLSHVGFVKVALRAPTETGMISDEESDEIGFVEDRLELEALRYRIGKYVGRIVSNGEAHFIYYLKYDFEWPDAVAAAMTHFPHYRFEQGSRMDAGWEVYEKLLLPTLPEWQMIHNHHACDRLQAAGDDLTVPRAIEHCVYFKTPEAMDAFAEAATAEKFIVQKKFPPTEEQPEHGLQFYRIDVPQHYAIDALTRLLIEMSGRFGGQYDGWETSRASA